MENKKKIFIFISVDSLAPPVLTNVLLCYMCSLREGWQGQTDDQSYAVLNLSFWGRCASAQSLIVNPNVFSEVEKICFLALKCDKCIREELFFISVSVCVELGKDPGSSRLCPLLDLRLISGDKSAFDL